MEHRITKQHINIDIYNSNIYEKKRMTHIVRRILGIERERKMLMIMAKEKTK